MLKLLRGLLPWALPALAAALLWAANSVSDLSAWRLGEIEQRPCGTAERDWQAAELRVRSRCRLYRAERTLSAAQLLDQALIINAMTRDGRVLINGQVLREPDPSPATSYSSIPVLLVVPAGVLHLGSNEIVIQLRSGAGALERIYLGEVYLGPRAILAPVWQRNAVVGQRGAQLALVVSFAITLFLLPIAWVRRHESLYRWFTLTLLASAIYISNFAFAWRPLPLLIWSVLVHAALALSLWSLIKFSHRFVGAPKPQHERVFGWLVVLAIAGFAVSRWPGLTWLFGFELVYRCSQVALLAYLATFWWQQRQRMTSPRPAWFAAAVIMLAVLGVFDSLAALGVSGQPLTSYTLHWGALYLLILLFAALVIRIVRALGDAERSQAQLVLALAERSAELETEFALRREAQQARTLAEERHRIMRDMHDGVGGQLVALIGQAQNGQLPAAELQLQLRRTLDDLRLMIDSLDGACADLSVALGMLRQRLDPAFVHLPVKIEWRTAQLPDLQPVPPTVVLNVMRIVQEAITNALKHAAASTIRVSAKLVEEGRESTLHLDIEDDGTGIAAEAERGRGLDSMQQRAQVIDASLDVRSGPTGTCVALRLAQGRLG